MIVGYILYHRDISITMAVIW